MMRSFSAALAALACSKRSYHEVSKECDTANRMGFPQNEQTSEGAAAVSSKTPQYVEEKGGSESGVEEADSGLAVDWEDEETGQRETIESPDTVVSDYGIVFYQQEPSLANMEVDGALEETGLTADELEIFFLWSGEGSHSNKI
ncbi:hypothetical protein CSAL01_06109 [Colletotrichum salicis]|uniref:Uncharacterized protein n=1 Tax=Colletotrichum salicis TaxID=1209931 RepID=A0A135VAL0_9PEZI|nr:hypothetical protein CSAL01_06109 [Colletotrichum salicis]